MSAITATVICVFVVSGLYTLYTSAQLYTTASMAEELTLLSDTDRKNLSVTQRLNLVRRDPALKASLDQSVRTIAMLACLEIVSLMFLIFQ